MSTLAVVGLQWGDEGKGKIVDLLAERADIVVRSQGGNNAGHSVIVRGAEYHFHLIPSGILSPQVTCLIGGGVVINPAALLDEIDTLEEKEISCRERLAISPYAHVVFPYHWILDEQMEEERGQEAIGTTGRGIGPCYGDAVARLGIRMGEFISPNVFRNKLLSILPIKNRFLEAPLVFDSIYEEYSKYAERLKDLIKPIETILHREIASGKRVLFEGAQGALLDVLYGTYPYVTSSHTTSGALALGSGVGPQSIRQVLGVIKAYATRVGAGPFPTEVNEGEIFLNSHFAREFGTTTGRKRRIGWFDAVMVSHAIRLNGVTSLALTKLDIFDTVSHIKICKGYYLDGEELSEPPLQLEDLERVEPIYQELKGWETETKKIKELEEFPKNVRIFLSTLKSLLGIPIDIVSFGPEREKTWQGKDFFK